MTSSMSHTAELRLNDAENPAATSQRTIPGSTGSLYVRKVLLVANAVNAP